MEYISAEEFLKQPEKVQKAFREWLEDNLQKYDWVYCEGMMFYIEEVKDTRKDNINIGRVFYIGNSLCWDSISDPDIIPVMAETYLRKFIEDKTNSIVEVLSIVDRGYTIRCSRKDAESKNRIFAKLGTDLLKAYWAVACKIAGEE